MNKRHEYKYLIDTFDKAILETRLIGLLQRDTHCNSDGYYEVRSMYLDNIDDICLSHNINGEDDRAKYRIRYYGNDHRHLYLEKKSKIRGICFKETAPLSLKEYKCLINNEELITKDERKLKLFNEINMYKLYPKVIVTYNRMAFTGDVGNVRITFDENVSSSNDLNLFLKGNYTRRNIYEPGKMLLEVKYSELMPKYIYEAMSLESYNQTTFSKYYESRLLHN